MSEKFSARKVDNILTRMRSGDQTAMEELYDCVSRPLFALCYGYFHNSHDSEDAMMEAFVTIKREIGKYNGTSGFNWIYTITKNICLKTLQKGKWSSPVDFTDAKSVDKYFVDNVEDGPSAFDESGIIRLSREVLNDHEYEILMFHAVYGMPYKDIAKFTGKIEATVRWQYHNAIGKVKKEYLRRYGNFEE